MMARQGVYFVSDVHLGLNLRDPADREERFVRFLRSIPADRTKALYLLGDIWDFWYEYRHVVPKGSVRVLAALVDLVNAGVEVFFFPGNHDMWCFHYFEELGIKVLREQPQCVEIDGKCFCLGHGDGLGPVDRGYKFLKGVFGSRVVQALFSSLHPTIAFGLGHSWSKDSRVSHKEYVFRGKDEPLCKFAEEYSRSHAVDYFIFGHYHAHVDMQLECGARLMMTKSWIDDSPYLYFDGSSVFGGYFQKSEK